jgi:hypothetical protein
MRQKCHDLNLLSLEWLALSRVTIALYTMVTGTMRIITGNSPNSIGMFSSRVYGLIMLIVGLLLLITTRAQWRCRLKGRLAAVTTAAVWLFIIGISWSAGAWVSISGAIVFVLILTNEIRTHEC